VRLFEVLIDDPKNDYLMLDTTRARAHQQAATGKGRGQDQTLGRSRGGLTTKIHILADGLGRPLRFILTPGHVSDVTKAEALIEGRRTGHVIADTSYDSRALREAIAGIGAKPVIPSNPTGKHPYAYDRTIYRLRNHIERCFNKLEHFRRFATRYDRRALHFLSLIQLAATMLWMR